MAERKIEEQKRTIAYILNNYKYGDIISDSILSKLLSYNIKYDKQYRRYIGMMIRIKDYLIEYQYILRRVRNGYYILKPSQVSRYCYRKNVTHAHNIIKKGIQILDNTDKTDLNEIQKEEIANLTKLSNAIDNQMDFIIKTSRYYSRKDYYDTLET